MKHLAKTAIASIALASLALINSGCARPFELGWGVAYSADERGKLIARNWDYEGKQLVDDVDSIFLLRPMGQLTYWSLK